MKIFDSHAQQMIEYLLVTAVIILALIVFLSPNGPVSLQLNLDIDKALNQLPREVRGPAQVRCESLDFVTAQCLVSAFATSIVSITLTTQESTSPCTSGGTFGPSQPNSMFVSGGCRGVFEVTYTSM